MRFYVGKNDRKYSRWGEADNLGEYYDWYCVFEPREVVKFAKNPSDCYDFYKPIVIAHTETFCRETDCWENDRTFEIAFDTFQKDFNLDRFRIADIDDCHHSNQVYYYKPLKRKGKQWICDPDVEKKGCIKDKELGENEKRLRENFEKWFKTVNIYDESFKEVLWKAYNQGHLDETPKSVDVSEEELEKQFFLDWVEECITHPSEMKKTPLVEQNDLVKVTFPCGGHDKCVAWPDVCDSTGRDGKECFVYVNLSKLCGVEESKKFKKRSDLLTKEEVDLLAKMVEKLRDE